MHVKKFEANSLDEAFKKIKQELGPDAIILKTVTNKGVKGIFKKSKIEITAAISEKNYTKKVKVDAVMDNEQKKKFYSGTANIISNMIDNYDEHNSTAPPSGGYGNIAINRPVKMIKNIENKVKSGLDVFLNDNVEEKKEALEKKPEPEKAEIKKTIYSQDLNKEIYDLQNQKIENLEKKLYELKKEILDMDSTGPRGIFQLRSVLRSFGISEKYITEICKKSLFELSKDKLEDADAVFDFALKEMLDVVKVALPIFSLKEAADEPVVMVLLGGKATGQTSMICKMSVLKPDSVIVRYKNNNQEFVEKMFDFNVIEAHTISEIILQTKKALDAGKSVFIDYQNISTEVDETKKFIDGLRRAFKMVEVLVSISAIHSEVYNQQKIKEYRSLTDGIVVSNLDLCLNFGSLFNIAETSSELPFKFFGTGDVVPDDIETATAERILAGIFQLG